MEDNQFAPKDTMTRKEYLKMKKRQNRKQNKRSISKITIMFCFVIVVLSVYVFTQLYVYSANQNMKYTAGEGIEETVYNAYYVVPSYTYDTSYSVNFLKTNGEGEKTILENTAFCNIVTDKDYIYGVREGVIYKLNKKTMEVSKIVGDNVEKFIKVNDILYFVTGNVKEGGKVEMVKIDGTGRKTIYEKYAYQIIGDDSGVYVISNEKTDRNIVKLGVNGETCDVLTENKASNIFLFGDYIYYANKSDNAKIYRICKNDKNDNKKVSDNSVLADKGEIKNLNGNSVFFVYKDRLHYINASDGGKLYSCNLDGFDDKLVLDQNIDTVLLKDSIVFYTSKVEMGFKSYNLETGLMKLITNKRLSEFIIE